MKILKFSNNKKFVIEILGTPANLSSIRETYQFLEKLRQKNDITLSQLKDAVYEAIMNEKLEWDSPLNHGGEGIMPAKNILENIQTC